MTYAIEGIDFIIQPTTGRWMPQSAIGITGNGHPIYPSVRMFEIRWNLISQDVVNQLQTWFSSVSFTGTSNVNLPQYNASTYGFTYYSGCVLYQPEFGVYFAEHTQDTVMLIGVPMV